MNIVLKTLEIAEGRSPVVCTGDLIKQDNAFILKNILDFIATDESQLGRY